MIIVPSITQHVSTALGLHKSLENCGSALSIMALGAILDYNHSDIENGLAVWGWNEFVATLLLLSLNGLFVLTVLNFKMIDRTSGRSIESVHQLTDIEYEPIDGPQKNQSPVPPRFVNIFMICIAGLVIFTCCTYLIITFI